MAKRKYVFNFTPYTIPLIIAFVIIIIGVVMIATDSYTVGKYRFRSGGGGTSPMSGHGFITLGLFLIIFSVLSAVKRKK